MKQAFLLSFSALPAVLLGTLTSVQAAPTVITTAQGQGADTSVRGGNYAARSFGNLDILRVRNSADLVGSRKAYLRFDLASLPSPVKNATGAALSLTVAPAENESPDDKVWTFKVHGLKDGVEGEKWDEKTTSWNSAPSNVADSSFKLNDDALLLGTFTVMGKGTIGQTVSFSSPQLLKWMQTDTDGVVSLILTRVERNMGANDSVVHIFASKEHGQLPAPALSIAFNGENPVVPTSTPPVSLPPAPTKALPFEAAIVNFEAADRANPPTKGGIVFVGSSSIGRWNTLARDFPGYNVLNRGFGGSQIIDSVHFAQRIVTPYEPKLVVFYAGSNDIAAKKSPETVLADYKAFVAQVRAKLPTTPIAFISIAPSPSRWSQVENVKKANALIANFSRTEPNLRFVDVFPLMLDENGQPRPELYVKDQLHMKPETYSIWIKAITPLLPPL